MHHQGVRGGHRPSQRLECGVFNNRVEQTTIGDGIRANVCYGCLVADNTVQAAAAFGIVLDESRVCKLYDNVVYRSQAEGIALLQATEDCLVLNNVSSQNGANGFITDGFRHHIDQNVFNFNGQSGLCIPGADNTFGRNTTRANGAICGPCSSNPPACVPPDVCLYGPGNSSFGDNMGPNPGC
ncbi:MAG: right-handed parallel beta-helix repeat-containing protein [Acidobacteriota bacterium]|nr:MAG: right-handed parallel beta-helix repeat-containing protein [Acidobacteriota bacterium]